MYRKELPVSLIKNTKQKNLMIPPHPAPYAVVYRTKYLWLHNPSANSCDIYICIPSRIWPNWSL